MANCIQAPSSTISSSSNAKNQRQVTSEEAEEWCKQNDVMQYVETSAKSGEGVERAFLEVAERIYQNIEASINERSPAMQMQIDKMSLQWNSS